MRSATVACVFLSILFFGAVSSDETDEYRQLVLRDPGLRDTVLQTRGYCRDQTPVICHLKRRQCSSPEMFQGYWAFLSFVVRQCPYTCQWCY